MKFLPRLRFPRPLRSLLLLSLFLFSANQLNSFWSWFKPLVKPPPVVIEPPPTNPYAGKTVIFPGVTKNRILGDLAETTIIGNDECDAFPFDLKEDWSETMKGVFGRGCFLKVVEGFAEYHLQNNTEIFTVQSNHVVDLSFKKFRIRGRGKAIIVYTSFVMPK